MSSRTVVPGRTLRWFLAALAAVCVALVAWSPSPAAAQSLDESEPVDGAALDAPPEQIVLRFDEPIGTDNRVSASCNGDPYVLPVGVLSADSLTLTVDAATPAPQGSCTVAWTVIGSETGDEASGTFGFEVQSSPVTSPGGATGDTSVTTTPATSPDDGGGDASISASPTVLDASSITDGPTWLGRLLSSLGLAVLFGALVLIVAAWPEGPEYVLAVRFLRSVWILALVGAVLYVVALSAGVNGESLGSGLNPSTWRDLVDAGWSGRAALARLVLTVLCGWVVLRPERVIDPTTQLPAIIIPTLAVATIGLSRTGGDLAVLGVFAGIGHALAMAIWFGAVVLLTRVVLAGPGDEDLVHAVRGFGRISGPAIIITVVTGLVQMYRLVGGALFSSGHGRIVLIKAVAVALMLFIGMTTRQVAGHRLARASDLAPGPAGNLRRAFGTEAAIGVVVLALSAGLMSYAPAKVSESDEDTFAVQETFVDETSGISLIVRLEPARVGTNRLQVEVRDPENGLAGLEVAFVPPAGSDLETIAQPISLSGAGIADSGAADGSGVPLDVAGSWTMQVSGTTSTGAMSGVSTPFDVRNADGSLPTSDIGVTPTAPPVTQAPTAAAAAATTVPG